MLSSIDLTNTPVSTNNFITQVPIHNYPDFTYTPYHHPDQPTASIQSCPPSIDMPHEPPQTSNDITSIANTNGDNFVVVNRNKNKNKIECVTPRDETSSSTPTSTSSTNTNSLNSKIIPTGKDGPSNAPGTNQTSNGTNCSKVITNQACRYAETRYPFPPFIMKFQQNVMEHSVIKELSNFVMNNYEFKLNIADYRIKNKNELLIFVGNCESFLFLLDEQKWPPTINAPNFEKIRPSRSPPQFSIIGLL
jgi:hypothetical protein